MKILFLAPDINLRLKMNGGAGTHMRASIDQLKLKGHEIFPIIGGDIFSNTRSGFHKIKSNSFLSQIKKIIPSELKKTVQDFRIIKLNKKIKNYILNNIDISSFDIIYERSGYGYDVGSYLSKKFCKPHVLESDVLMLDLKKEYTSKIFNNFIYRFLEKKKFHNASSIAVQSQYSVNICKNYWDIRHDKIYNKDLGISISNQKFGDNSFELKKSLNLSDKIVIGFVGYFMPYQKIEILLEAALKFIKNKNVVFLFVGGGQLIEKYKHFKTKNDLDNVSFTGIVDKTLVHKYYGVLDIAVIPNCAFHMYPVKFLEYVINKLPVAIPNFEVFQEFYENNDVFNEYVFEPKNPDSLFNKLIYIINNLERLTTQMNFSYNYAKTKKTWSNCGNNLDKILKITCKNFSLND